MKFMKTNDGIEYVTDEFGVIHQVNPQPYKYDASYVDIYRAPEYAGGRYKLMGIRMAMTHTLYLLNMNSEPISLMDIGYGDGSFLEEIKGTIPNRYGYDITGEELPEGCKPGNILDPMDIITMWDVFEHIHDLSFIGDIKAKMVCMSMPDVTNKDFENWKHRKPDEHVHHFTPESLEKLMLSYDWKMIHTCHLEDNVRKGDYQNIMTSFFIKSHIQL